MDSFLESLKLKVNQETAPYGLACLFRSVIKNESTAFGFMATNEWGTLIKKVLTNTTNLEFDVLIENDTHLAIIVSDSNLNNTDQLIRILRNQLMRECLSSTLSIAAAQVDDLEIDVDQLLADICASLRCNIEDKSSRIEVKYYKT